VKVGSGGELTANWTRRPSSSSQNQLHERIGMKAFGDSIPIPGTDAKVDSSLRNNEHLL
jgi:hypothetical protein